MFCLLILHLKNEGVRKMLIKVETELHERKLKVICLDGVEGIVHRRSEKIGKRRY